MPDTFGPVTGAADSTQPDLTAASLMLGKLIDPEHQRKVRRERITRELNAKLRGSGIEPLAEDDVNWIAEGRTEHPEIDGMPAAEWVDAMTMD